MYKPISVGAVQERCRQGKPFDEIFHVETKFPDMPIVVFRIEWDTALSAAKAFPITPLENEHEIQDWKILLRVDRRTHRLIRRYFEKCYCIRCVENVSVLGSEKRIRELIGLSETTNENPAP